MTPTSRGTLLNIHYYYLHNYNMIQNNDNQWGTMHYQGLDLTRYIAGDQSYLLKETSHNDDFPRLFYFLIIATYCFLWALH